jgi:uncharacterized protein
MIKDITSVITIAVLAFIALGVGAYWISTKTACLDFNQASVQIDDTTLSVALAVTQQEQMRGLGGCHSIPPQSGLYFMYETPQNVAIWMRGMLIPIDIVWIADGEVIGIERDIPPPDDHKTTLLPQYRPPRPVDGVLEIAGGKANDYGITVGSRVELLTGR